MNYGIYNSLVPDGTNMSKSITINTDDIKKEIWYDEYIMPLKYLFDDYIEHECLQSSTIVFNFPDGEFIELALEDALMNICAWGFLVNFDTRIQSYHIFYEERFTSSALERYINEFCIIPHRYDNNMSFAKFNDSIYKVYRMFTCVDNYAAFMNNNLNMADFIDMADNCKEFDEIIHKDYSIYPPDQVNNVAAKDTNRLMELMMNSKDYIGRDVGTINMFRSNSGINKKQFREFAVLVGPKPAGNGTVFNYLINTSYLVGCLNQIPYALGDSMSGRLAQIITKKNTADSGTMARYLDLNNCSTHLYYDPKTMRYDAEYDCHTRNFVKVYVKNLHRLRILADRYYRLDPNGKEYRIGPEIELDENHPLIGHYIYLRSPMTCRSAAAGHGICHKCYGELFHTNKNINVGKVAAEEHSAKITQKMLSAKHVNESKLQSIVFINTNTKMELDWFMIQDSSVYLNSDLSFTNFYLQINSEDIISSANIYVSDDDDTTDNYFVKTFNIITDSGEVIPITTSIVDNLNLTKNLYNIMQKYRDDEMYNIPLEVLYDVPMFDIELTNDDMINKLNNIENVIDLESNVSKFDLNTFYEEYINAIEIAGIDMIMSVHSEIILSNQIIREDNELEKPDWSSPNQQNYRIITLKKALKYNPSVSISIQSDNLTNAFKNPLTFKKTKPSSYDVFLMVNPKEIIDGDPSVIKPHISPFIKVEDNTKE